MDSVTTRSLTSGRVGGSLEPMMVVVTLIGAAVGALGGMFGTGGSAVATPLLHLAGVPALVAVASPLPAAIPSTAVAARAYPREGMIDRRVLRRTALFGVPPTLAGPLGPPPTLAS